MKSKTKIWLALLGMLVLVSCGRTIVPAAANPYPNVVVKNDCDSLIKDAMLQVKKKDSFKGPDCRYFEKMVFSLSQKLSAANIENAELKKKLQAIPAPPVTIITGKVKNSFNDVQKNSNNQTEVYNLKKSIMQKADSIAILTANNIALDGKLKANEKEITRLKNSSHGDQSPNTVIAPKKGSIAGDGNTQDNSRKLAWWWVFVAGYLSSVLVRRVAIPLVSKYVPFLSILNKIV